MHGNLTTFWGKLDPTSGEWHPLIDHSADVAACCEAILQTTLIRKRLARLAGWDDLSEVHVARLCVLAALHDIGKFNLGFQNKAYPDAKPTNGHVQEVMLLLGNGYDLTSRLLESLSSVPLDGWGPSGLFAASICHHGRPLAWGDGTFDARIWAKSARLDPFEGIRELAERTRIWFPEAFTAPEGDPLPEAADFQHAFSGLVMLADWLGSSRGFFPYSDPGDGDRMPIARAKAREAVRWIGLDTGLSRDSLDPGAEPFSLISGFSPRPAQERLLNIELPGADGSLIVLEAETGSGKTEAALAHFLRLFRAGLVDGMTFALPTRTSATQIYDRVFQAITRAFPGQERRPVCVLAVPGYLTVDDWEGKRLPGFEVLWNDDPKQRDRFRGWVAENPKRYLAGSIVVGTIDQVLLSTLMTSHAHLRATALLRHLLVVDEVHASDAYMNRLLEDVLKFHARAGGHALLMSATLGSETKRRLLKAASMNAPQLSLREAQAVAYPLVQSGAQSWPMQAEAVDKTVLIQLEPIQDSPETVAHLALEGARAGGRVLVLRNTVRACLETQQALERLAGAESGFLFRCSGRPTPHHARYARPDRIALDQAIELEFGKRRPSGGLAVVATQTVQQSLDLDSDLLISDLCPMDVLLQRIGRLHRHSGRTRAPGFERPRCVVLLPEAPNMGEFLQSASGEPRGAHGYGLVYGDLRILEATWRELRRRPEIAIPSMNRELVEATTHPEALGSIVEELGGAWARHQTWVRGKFYGDQRLGELQSVDRSKEFGEYSFPPKELAGRVQTRLGEGDRLLEFESPIPGVFAGTFQTLPVAAFLARGIPDDAKPAILSTANDRLELLWGERRFAYDRLGFRPWNAPEENEE